MELFWQPPINIWHQPTIVSNDEKLVPRPSIETRCNQLYKFSKRYCDKPIPSSSTRSMCKHVNVDVGSDVENLIAGMSIDHYEMCMRKCKVNHQLIEHRSLMDLFRRHNLL